MAAATAEYLRVRCVSRAGPRPGPAPHASVAVEFDFTEPLGSVRYRRVSSERREPS